MVKKQLEVNVMLRKLQLHNIGYWKHHKRTIEVIETSGNHINKNAEEYQKLKNKKI